MYALIVKFIGVWNWHIHLIDLRKPKNCTIKIFILNQSFKLKFKLILNLFLFVWSIRRCFVDFKVYIVCCWHCNYYFLDNLMRFSSVLLYVVTCFHPFSKVTFYLNIHFTRCFIWKCFYLTQWKVLILWRKKCCLLVYIALI